MLFMIVLRFHYSKNLIIVLYIHKKNDNTKKI